ncbi:helix-turn-helix domain-containing protein [Paenibacillus sp. IB182496]|uniref:Helix-turn-helix domain-containing protein n=1 Tax=Paenibacillus sabuli TaxID=2772509 RepID=A0A927GSA0_9BACL|nr:helix-turn-helix domain-containing protein [Paenibacillus sabuli]MBD2845492.1 helix-turn-helix domain-containing protein [Paenibacillus sabuli]
MNRNACNPQADELSGLLYSLIHITSAVDEEVPDPAGAGGKGERPCTGTMRMRPRHAFLLLLVEHGAGMRRICGDERLQVQGGEAILLSPDSAEEIVIDCCGRSRYWAIEFQTVRIVNGQAETAELPLTGAWPVPELADQLAKVRTMDRLLKTGGWERLRAAALLHELLAHLLPYAQRAPEADADVPGHAIDQAASYMERHYREPITRELLAERAGMSADYFSRLFKRRYGQTPLAYLAAVRIAQAKRELALTGDALRMVAQRVGFNDEFYFSRKFKLVAGLSPSAYVSRIRTSVRIVALQHHLTGHLLALGMVPYAALVNGYYPLPEQLRGIVPIGGYRPDLDKLAEARPDLIVTYEQHDEITAPKVPMFEHIAPTVTIPFALDWREQLRQLAVAIGRRETAERWLAHYEEEAAAARTTLAPRLGREEVLIAGIGPDHVCLFGRRNVGAVLYGDLQAQMPDGIADIEYYRVVTLEELFGYDSDRILLTSFRNDGTPATLRKIGDTMRRLQADPRWQRLRAVRRGAVYSLLEHQHLYTLYTSYSHQLLLGRLQRLFGTEMSK